MSAAAAATAAVADTPASYWLLKAEPNPHMVNGRDMGSQPWSLLVAKDGLTYDGVRNYTARNNIRDRMRLGDRAFYYHSSCAVPAIMGIAEVVRTYPDPKASDPAWPFYDAKHTAAAPRWWSADLRPVRALQRPVTLSEIRALGDSGSGPLAQLALLRQSRLSVQPVTAAEWACLVSLEEAAPPSAPPAKKKKAAAAAAATKQPRAATEGGEQEGDEAAAPGAGAAAAAAAAAATATAVPATKAAAGKRAAGGGESDGGGRAGKKKRA